MKKIWITGKNGQLGKCLQEAGKNQDDFTLLFTGKNEVDFLQLDQIESFLTEESPDLVINCAAYTNVELAEEQIDLSYEINEKAIETLGQKTAELNIPVIHISTDYVFDGYSNSPIKEDQPTNPLSIYGKSKYKGELSLERSNRYSYIIRTSWLYSPFGNNFMNKMLTLGKERASLSVVFDQTGTPTSAIDLAQDLLLVSQAILSQKKAPTPGIYHYANEGVCSWYDFAKAVMEFSKTNCKVSPVLSKEFPTKAERPNYSVLDKTKFKTIFKKDLPHWRESLKTCLEKMKTPT